MHILNINLGTSQCTRSDCMIVQHEQKVKNRYEHNKSYMILQIDPPVCILDLIRHFTKIDPKATEGQGKKIKINIYACM